MEIKHASSYNKKNTIAVFVKVEDDSAILSSFEDEHRAIFEELVANNHFESCMPFAIAYSEAHRIIFITYTDVKNYTSETWRRAGSLLVSAMRVNAIKDIDVEVAPLFAEIASIESYEDFCCGILLSSYNFTKYLGAKRLKSVNTVSSVSLVSDNKKDTEEAIKNAITIYNAVEWTRDMVNEPSNVINSLNFVERATKECQDREIKTTVIDEKQMKTLGLNGILAVNAGSANPARMFIGEYRPANAKKTIVLVGKGITFDTGGMSLKSADSMYGMKDDMAGAAAVCGALYLIADKNLDANVIAIAPLTDNKTGSGAQNPGDIVRMYNGVTIEVGNTDAEGRIILGDALAYAIKNYQPDYIIDIATLTGACTVALGQIATAVLGNDKEFINVIKEAGDETYERVWELPMFEEYGAFIKSDVADILNTGGKNGGGTILAAFFLSHFTEGAKWAHLDIAGTSYLSKARYYEPKDATGVGVRLLTATVERLSVL